LTLDPTRTALIIEDLQNDSIGEGGAFADSGAPAHAASQNVEGLAAAARAAGVQHDPRRPAARVRHRDARDQRRLDEHVDRAHRRATRPTPASRSSW
jgi:hypothetical protein